MATKQGKRFKAAAAKVDSNKLYTLNDAVKLLTGTKEVREPSNYYRKPILAMQSC